MHVIVRTCIFLTTAPSKGHSRSLAENLLHKDFVLTHVSGMNSKQKLKKSIKWV